MNDDPHAQMAYPSEEQLKQEYDQEQSQSQGQGVKTEVSLLPARAHLSSLASAVFRMRISVVLH